MTDYSIVRRVCRTCHWWDKPCGEHRRECHRYAPVADKRGNPVFPIMPVYGRCGDYKKTKRKYIEGKTASEFWACVAGWESDAK